MEHFPVRKRIRLPLPVYTQGHAFFITIATHQKYPWFSLYPKLGDAVIQIIRDLASVRGTKVYAWCIMPDHIHLLVQDHEVVSFVRLFKGRLTPRAREIEPGRRLWQRSFYDHALRKEESVAEIACYIWENPVRKGTIDDPTQYEWSGSEVFPDWKELYGRG